MFSLFFFAYALLIQDSLQMYLRRKPCHVTVTTTTAISANADEIHDSLGQQRPTKANAANDNTSQCSKAAAGGAQDATDLEPQVCFFSSFLLLFY